MPGFSMPAILLRKREYGDYDLIATLFSRSHGKLAVIAKAAKKSRKRFAGTLELFSFINIVTSAGRGKGLAVLQEASLARPFSGIRSDIVKTAYASYWVELVDEWMEPGQANPELFDLLVYVLTKIDAGETPGGSLSMLFQLRFMILSGFSPDLGRCTGCRTELDRIKENRLNFDLEGGGLRCPRCASAGAAAVSLSKGTVKELRWVKDGNLAKAGRIRFSPRAVAEGLKFLEAFVPFHLGKEPKSLRFLRQIRQPFGQGAPYP